MFELEDWRVLTIIACKCPDGGYSWFSPDWETLFMYKRYAVLLASLKQWCPLISLLGN